MSCLQGAPGPGRSNPPCCRPLRSNSSTRSPPTRPAMLLPPPAAALPHDCPPESDMAASPGHAVAVCLCAISSKLGVSPHRAMMHVYCSRACPSVLTGYRLRLTPGRAQPGRSRSGRACLGRADGGSGVQMAPVGLPGEWGQEPRGGLAHRVQRARLAVPDAHHARRAWPPCAG